MNAILSSVTSLSPRELEVLQLSGKAFSAKSVAKQLNISPGTVKWHLKNIYTKMHSHTREHAVVRARELGLID